MPSKKHPTVVERFAVWRAYESRCFWCGELASFLDCQIDHVIPKKVTQDGDISLNEIIRLYDLPSDFSIESFSNWVLCHPSCNRRKADFVLEPSPAMVLSFKLVLMKARIARMHAEAIDKDNKKAPIIAKILHATETGVITKEEIMELFADLPVILRRSAFEYVEELLLSPEWSVIVREHDITVRRH